MSTLPFDFVLTKHLTASDSICVPSLQSSQLIPLDVLQFLHIHLKYRDKKIKYSNEDLVNLQGRFTHTPNSYLLHSIYFYLFAPSQWYYVVDSINLWPQ